MVGHGGSAVANQQVNCRVTLEIVTDNVQIMKFRPCDNS